MKKLVIISMLLSVIAMADPVDTTTPVTKCDLRINQLEMQHKSDEVSTLLFIHERDEAVAKEPAMPGWMYVGIGAIATTIAWSFFYYNHNSH